MHHAARTPLFLFVTFPLFALSAVLLVAAPLLAGEPDEQPGARPLAPTGEPAPRQRPVPGEPPAPAEPEVAGAPSTAEIEALVAQLGAPDFGVRERASRELFRIGEPARKALERTMTRSDNMEARWRAEQLLRRLDHEGERAVGRGDQGRPGPTPHRDRGPGAIQPRRGWAEIERRIDEIFRRQLGQGFGAFGSEQVKERLEASGLVLDVSTFGPFVQVTLHAPGWDRPLVGRSLEELIRRRPGLGELDGMSELQEKWGAFKKEHPSLFPFERSPLRPGFSMDEGGQGIEIQQGPDGVKVTLRETGEDGKEAVRTYEGESLEEIKRKHPEIASRLEGFGFSVHLGAPQVLRRDGRTPRLPVPPAPPSAPQTTPGEQDAESARDPFGLALQRPEPVLAAHLGLDEGSGAQVVAVEPGSPAARLGLQRHDVILRINGAPVADLGRAVAALRDAARTSRLSCEVIRRGQRLTLER